mgnify:CR=1 FL=1
MASTNSELIVAAGECRTKNLLCCKCNRTPTKWEQHPRYSWCLVLICKKCRFKWFVCTVCDSIRCCYVNPNSLAPHGSKFHSNTANQSRKRRRGNNDTCIVSNREGDGCAGEDDNGENDDGEIFDGKKDDDDTTIIAASVNTNDTEQSPSDETNTTDDIDLSGQDDNNPDEEELDNDKKPSAIRVNDLNYLGNDASINYFLHASKGYGSKYLVSYASYHSPLYTEKISDVDADLHMRLARFCNDLTSKQIVVLADVLKVVMQRTENSASFMPGPMEALSVARKVHPPVKMITSTTESKGKALTGESNDTGLEIPSDVKAFRQLFYDGKFCIESNLPKPTVAGQVIIVTYVYKTASPTSWPMALLWTISSWTMVIHLQTATQYIVFVAAHTCNHSRTSGSRRYVQPKEVMSSCFG